MQKYFKWFAKNNLQIVWFLVGFFISQAIEAFARGDWNGVLLALAFAGANYYINRT
jgi:hypothetical protein